LSKSGLQLRNAEYTEHIPLPNPAAECSVTSAGRPVACAYPSAMATADACCRAIAHRTRSGQSAKNGSCVDPGLPNTTAVPFAARYSQT
jgi:hypothetical protein